MGYRFEHISNADLANPNPGLNMHLFTVSYLFLSVGVRFRLSGIRLIRSSAGFRSGGIILLSGESYEQDTESVWHVAEFRSREWPAGGAACAAATGEGGRRPGLAAAGVDPAGAGVGAAQLRRQAGRRKQNVRALANWKPMAPRTEEIPFVVARIVLQDFTGVPLLVDLAAMRSAAGAAGQESQADRAAGAGGSGGGPLGAGGLSTARRMPCAGTWRWNSSATGSAINSSSGGCRPLRPSRWCRRASASCTR